MFEPVILENPAGRTGVVTWRSAAGVVLVSLGLYYMVHNCLLLGFLLSAIGCYIFVMQILTNQRVSMKGKAVLITGCDTGKKAMPYALI